MRVLPFHDLCYSVGKERTSQWRLLTIRHVAPGHIQPLMSPLLTHQTFLPQHRQEVTEWICDCTIFAVKCPNRAHRASPFCGNCAPIFNSLWPVGHSTPSGFNHACHWLIPWCSLLHLCHGRMHRNIQVPLVFTDLTGPKYVAPVAEIWPFGALCVFKKGLSAFSFYFLNYCFSTFPMFPLTGNTSHIFTLSCPFTSSRF